MGILSNVYPNFEIVGNTASLSGNYVINALSILCPIYLQSV